ncbi:hypothetical protein MIR68_001723 [Amoeboaphelidium protococcarum]|nr:hypothetical protein MIR68_001723 [Amoeboaphelidium protococcarum]
MNFISAEDLLHFGSTGHFVPGCGFEESAEQPSEEGSPRFCVEYIVAGGVHNLKAYTPKLDPRHLFDGTFYMPGVGAKCVRQYSLHSTDKSNNSADSGEL